MQARPEWTVVSGGNRGIGLDICKKLIGQGQRVILCSRDLQKGRQIAGALCPNPDTEALCHAAQLDVSDPQSIRSFIAEITGDNGKQINGLINNAGVFLSGWSAQVFDSSMSTNYRGPLDLALGLMPHMSKGGKVVNVSSSLSQLRNVNQPYQGKVTSAMTLDDLRTIAFDPQGDPSNRSWPAYSLSKAMLNRATQILAQHPDFRHLSINAADPGWCRSEMGGPAASRSIDQGSSSVLAVYNMPQGVTGGFFYDGQPREIA